MRPVRAILALYVLVWFHVVVPTHTRGVVTMPGTGDSHPTSTGSSCCGEPSTGGPKHTPNPDQQRRCAVCFVASTYTVPVVYTLDLQPADLVEQLSLSAAAQVCSLDYPAPYWPTGPPAHAA
jgi:hypothetical protein